MYYIERSFSFMSDEETTIFELTEESIESMVYEIRGQKVLLDFDLARIYGYATRDFNNQIKHNIERFENDFRFRLTKEEWLKILKLKKSTSRESDGESNKYLMSQDMTSNDSLRLKKSTAKELSSKRRYNPYAFTEQGVYMLMTVLKGELAVKQSKALIRLFKKMKDYIVDNSLQINNASLINEKFITYERHFEIVDSKLDILMDNFVDPQKYKQFIFVNGERIEADIAYQTIYSLAKYSIIIIDDYISIKTLRHLKVCPPNISIMIFSDNVSKDKVTDTDLEDFYEDTGIRILMMPTNNEWHDRFIIIDYKKDSETIYTSGSSSKDTGKKTTTIIEVGGKEAFHTLFDNLLGGIEVL